MFSTLMITLREGLEAFLIVAISMAYLRKSGRGELVGAVKGGLIAAIVLSIGLGIILARIGALTPVWEGTLALLAAILVIYCTVHMFKMGKHMKKEIDTRLGSTQNQSHGKAYLAVFGFTLLMVGREGIETATMLASLAVNQTLQHLLWGGLVGVVLAGLMAMAWGKYGHKVNLSRFFQVTAIFMVLFSIQLVIYAFHEYSEAGVLPLLDNEYWHEATEDWSPQGHYGQWLSYGLILVPGVWLLYAWLKDKSAASSAPLTAEAHK